MIADSEHINHPIDWPYCLNCGAKVVNDEAAGSMMRTDSRTRD